MIVFPHLQLQEEDSHTKTCAELRRKEDTIKKSEDDYKTSLSEISLS
jgi:hypothetical protein